MDPATMTNITSVDYVMPTIVNGDSASRFVPLTLDNDENNILHPFSNYVIGVYLSIIGKCSVLYPTNILCVIFKNNLTKLNQNWPNHNYHLSHFFISLLMHTHASFSVSCIEHHCTGCQVFSTSTHQSN